MTTPRDPIEQWLSADVELLPAPPGAYQRVSRRARRRKAVRATSTAAGAAVVVAAAVSLPQILGGLLPGDGGPSRINSGTTSRPSTSAPSHRVSSRPQPSSTPTSPASPGPSLSSAGAGSRPAAGFRPSSVTFIGASIGAVIGQAGSSCGAAPCTAVAATPDYGTTWTAIGAPDAGPPHGSSGVSQIRFLDPTNGWAYGPALYATHNGGSTWTSITALPGRVIDLSTVGSMAFAVVASCTGSGPDYAAHCGSFALFATAAGKDRWRPVPGAAATVPVTAGGLQLTSQAGYLLAGRRLFTGPVTGGGWHQVRGGPGAPPCLRGARSTTSQQGPALIAPAGSELYLACGAARAGSGPGPLTLYVSPDAGRTWQARGTITATGTATSLAAIPGGPLVLATSIGIWFSQDALSWHRASLPGRGPGGGYSFVGMTNAQQGVAVPVDTGLREIFITRDGGLSWQPSPIL